MRPSSAPGGSWTGSATWGLTDVELLTGDEARSRWPWLSPDVRAARYRARDGWLDPKRLSVGYATAASNAAAIPDATPGGGATFVNHAGAHEIVVDGDRVRGVRTTRGEVAAGAVVIATGPYLSQTAGLAGIGVELRPTRRQKLVLPSVPQVPADAPMTIEEETAAHWRPVLDGAMALFTDPGTPPSEPHDPVPIEHDWAFGLLDPHSDHALARVAPFWRDVWADGAPSAHWFLQAGQYEMTPDRRPYLGPLGPEGLHLNGGYSGHGIMASAGGSRRVVDLITGATDPAENSFRPDRQIDVREHDILSFTCTPTSCDSVRRRLGPAPRRTVARTTEDGDDRDEYPRQASPQGAGKAETPAAARPANGPASSGGERSDTHDQLAGGGEAPISKPRSSSESSVAESSPGTRTARGTTVAP